ncbi:unnamed protein product, partial [Candidula unifasciata]
DLAYNRSAIGEITDGNDGTCGTNGKITITVDLDRPYIFTWLRVRFSRAGVLPTVDVAFSYNSGIFFCHNPRRSSLDSQTMDIYCDVGSLIDSVFLSGSGVKIFVFTLCRNIALKQLTQQTITYAEVSSDVNNPYIEFASDRAVDGKSDPKVNTEKACAILERDGTPPSWTLILPSMQNITRFVIYSTVESKTQIAGFTLECFLENSTRVFQYVDTSPIKRNRYIVVPPKMYSGIQKVVVRHSSTNIVFSLCEVEVYGDSMCESKRYGHRCEHTCGCAGNATCFPSTRMCPAGCAPGYQGAGCDLVCQPGRYGNNCTSSCSGNCMQTGNATSRRCDPITGRCLKGCMPGFTGETCHAPCPPGTYGYNCESICSFNCRREGTHNGRVCDHITGKCLTGCEIGYTGFTCQTGT